MHEQPQKFNGIFDTIFNQVDKYLPIAIGSFQAFQKPKTQGQAKGKAAIQAFVNQILQGLNSLSQTKQQASAEQILPLAQQLRSALDDNAQVYQAKSGEDADILNKGKIDADKIIFDIKAYYSQTQSTGTILTTNSSGQLVTVNNPNITQTATETNYLTYIGIALAIIALVKK